MIPIDWQSTSDGNLWKQFSTNVYNYLVDWTRKWSGGEKKEREKEGEVELETFDCRLWLHSIIHYCIIAGGAVEFKMNKINQFF